MLSISGVVPFKFYEVKERDAGLFVQDLSERFRVPPDRIERETPNNFNEPLQPGEMLLIHNS